MDREDHERLKELFKENRELIKEMKEKKQSLVGIPRFV